MLMRCHNITTTTIDNNSPPQEESLQLILTTNERTKSVITTSDKNKFQQIEIRYKNAAFVVVLDVGTILYYAIFAEAITTVAHACAIILGAVLWMVATKISFSMLK